jgi:hypothetical protein
MERRRHGPASRLFPARPCRPIRRRGDAGSSSLRYLDAADGIATEAQRRSRVMQCSPSTPQLLCRPIDQSGNLAIKLRQVRASQPVLLATVWAETGGRPARVLASRSVVEWGFHGLAGSAMRYTRPRPLWPRQERARAFSSRFPRRRRARCDAASRSRLPPRRRLPLQADAASQSPPLAWRGASGRVWAQSFNYDFRVSFTPEEVAKGELPYNYGTWPYAFEEWPGISVFWKDDAGDVFHTYSTYGRGVE